MFDGIANPNPWVVQAIYYPGTGSGYWFGDTDSYSGYGMIAKVVEQRGTIGLDPAFNYHGLRGFRSDGKTFGSFPDIDQFAAEMDDFARCILTNTASKVSGEEGLRDIRILMAVYESIKSGQPVKLGS